MRKDSMRKEYGNWKMLFFAVGYPTGVAYISALLVNVFGNLIFKGTSAVEPKVLEISLMQISSEYAVVNGNM